MPYTSRLSTDLLPHMFRPNTYGGNYDPRENDYLSSELGNLTIKQQEKYRNDFNYELFFDDCAEHQRDTLLILSSYIKNVLPTFSIEKPEGYKINRPTSYNYGGDRVNFNFSIELDEVFNYINSLDDKLLSNYLYTTFKSYDGFSSFMPQSKTDLVSFLTEGHDLKDIDRGIAAVINYMISVEFDEIENACGEIYLSDYLGDLLTYNDTKAFRKIYDKHCQ